METSIRDSAIRILLYCEHGKTPTFTALEEILESPGLVDPTEWIDLDNRQLLPPYGALEIQLPGSQEAWFSQGAEDIECYVRFLSHSLYATEQGGIPEHQMQFMMLETVAGIPNIAAKIHEQSGKRILLQVAEGHLQLIDIDQNGIKREQQVAIELWRQAAVQSLKTFARFYQQIVLPAYLSSSIKDEVPHSVEVISKDLAFHLGEDYCFSQPYS